MNTDRRRFKPLCVLSFAWLGGLLLAGCAMPAASPRDAQAPAMPATVIADPYPLTTLFTIDGQPTDWNSVLQDALKADVIVIGEQHGQPVGLSAAAGLWRSILAAGSINRLTTRAALALEFIERDQQPHLSALLNGEIDEAMFLARTNKTLAWSGGYPPAHRDMVEAARAQRTPVVAANAPRRLARLARTDGYNALSFRADTQPLAALPYFSHDPAPPDNRYWRDFLSFMGTTPETYSAGTSAEREKVNGMFRAQSVWDATMADSVIRALDKGHRPVVLVVGQFHSDYHTLGGGGLMQELLARRPSTRTYTLSFEHTGPTPPRWRETDRGRADVIVYAAGRD